MKKIVATTKKEDITKILSFLKDRVYFTREEGELVRITIYVQDGDLDELIEHLEKSKKCHQGYREHRNTRLNGGAVLLFGHRGNLLLH
ncbi:MAG: hypothetical protein U9N35_05805 [Euryarchaeota archaeon]|nr:hypothetical protein [Euryarchaeota archaeon]